MWSIGDFSSRSWLLGSGLTAAQARSAGIFVISLKFGKWHVIWGAEISKRTPIPISKPRWRRSLEACVDGTLQYWQANFSGQFRHLFRFSGRLWPNRLIFWALFNPHKSLQNNKEIFPKRVNKNASWCSLRTNIMVQNDVSYTEMHFFVLFRHIFIRNDLGGPFKLLPVDLNNKPRYFS